MGFNHTRSIVEQEGLEGFGRGTVRSGEWDDAVRVQQNGVVVPLQVKVDGVRSEQSRSKVAEGHASLLIGHRDGRAHALPDGEVPVAIRMGAGTVLDDVAAACIGPCLPERLFLHVRSRRVATGHEASFVLDHRIQHIKQTSVHWFGGEEDEGVPSKYRPRGAVAFLEKVCFGLGRMDDEDVCVSASPKVEGCTGSDRDHVHLVPRGVGERREEHVQQARVSH